MLKVFIKHTNKRGRQKDVLICEIKDKFKTAANLTNVYAALWDHKRFGTDVPEKLAPYLSDAITLMLKIDYPDQLFLDFSGLNYQECKQFKNLLLSIYRYALTYKDGVFLFTD